MLILVRDVRNTRMALCLKEDSSETGDKREGQVAVTDQAVGKGN